MQTTDKPGQLSYVGKPNPAICIEDVPNMNGRSTTFLEIRGQEPLNAEPELAALVQFPRTPDDLIYCRNHSEYYFGGSFLKAVSKCSDKGAIRQLDPETFKLKVDGAVDKELEFTLSEFKHAFPHRVEVVAALQVRMS